MVFLSSTHHDQLHETTDFHSNDNFCQQTRNHTLDNESKCLNNETTETLTTTVEAAVAAEVTPLGALVTTIRTTALPGRGQM
ncbi:unnamed protein product [Fusarium graminearum]|uniref:Uncharacterized protein n=1 Tax=Gibberella zeae TaxID=5518 RepID=A0A9N8RQF7_GIBZA|nr:unnamed protein product [Fusarium graminearum]